jgi:flavin-dependent dehydrogenase
MVASSSPGTPVRIAGAGPSGLAAAIVLARAGRAVEVHEARATVGHRFIGDFQVLENSSRPGDVLEDLRAAGIEPTFAHEPAHQAVLFDHRLRPTAIHSARPYGYFLSRGPERGTLDRGLLEQARSLGVTVRFASRAKPEEVDLVATGPAMADGLAREMTFATPLPDCTWVLFDQRLAPGGYAYLFVRRGYATFGVAITRDFPSIDRRFVACRERFETLAPFAASGVRHGYSYMNFTLAGSATVAGRPYVGEAGGFQDYLFGLGIRYALTTGILAARSLLEGGSYDELWRRELGERRRAGLVNRLLYERGGNAGLVAFLGLARGRDFARFLGFWYGAPWWKRALVPLVAAWWRRRGGCRHAVPEHWCRRDPPAATRRRDEVEQAGAAPRELGEIRGAGSHAADLDPASRLAIPPARVETAR